MSKNLFGTDTFSVCVGELHEALAAMKPLGKEATTVEFTAHGVRGQAVAREVAVKLHWVDGGPKESVRVDRLYLLDFLKGAPDGALVHFETGGDVYGLAASVVKHGVSLETILPEGSELLEETLTKWAAEICLAVDPIGAAAFFRVAKCCSEDAHRYALVCVRLVPRVQHATFVGTDGREMRAEEVRLLEAMVVPTPGVSIPPLVVEVLGKWGRWKESRVEFSASAPDKDGGRWVAASCGGLRVCLYVGSEAQNFPKWEQVLDGYGEPWIWRVPATERERLAALVPVMPPDSWGGAQRTLVLQCEPGVTEAVSSFVMEMAGNRVPIRAELVEQPAGAGSLVTALDPARFLSALSGGVEEILLRESENDGAIVIFRGPGVRHGVMPLHIGQDDAAAEEKEGEAGKAEGVSEPKEGTVATVTISGPGMTRTVITHDQLKAAAKRVGKRAKKQADEAGKGDASHG